jgi:hypothetical protein
VFAPARRLAGGAEQTIDPRQVHRVVAIDGCRLGGVMPVVAVRGLSPLIENLAPRWHLQLEAAPKSLGLANDRCANLERFIRSRPSGFL